MITAVRIRLAGLAAMAVLAALSEPAAAQAAQRYAAPSGSSGNPCTQSSPCDLATAIGGAASGDEVIVGSGDYGSSGSPLTSTISSSAANLDIHGPAATDKPRIFISTASMTANGLVLTGSGTALRDVEIDNVNAGAGALALFIDAPDTTVERVIATTAGYGSTSPSTMISAAIVASATSTVRDTVASAPNPGPGGGSDFAGEALRVQGHGDTGTGVVRNVTAATSPTSDTYTLDIVGLAGASSVAVTNTIMAGPNSAIVRGANGGTMNAAFSHDNYTSPPAPSLPDGTYTDDGTSTMTAPVFVNAAAGDFRQQPTSTATIDRGAADPSDETLDFEGDVRTIGSAPDIGADELPAVPAAVTTNVDSITATTAVVHGAVDPGGGDTGYSAQYGTSGFDLSTTGSTALPRTVGPTAVSVALSGLAPATTYHVRLQATNIHGSVTSQDIAFTTASAATTGGTGAGATTSGTSGSGGGAGTAGQTQTPAIVFGGAATTMLQGGAIVVTVPTTVSCPKGATACQVSVNATVTLPAAQAAASKRKKLKTVTIGTASFSVAPGASKKVAFRLNRKGAGLLRRLKRLTAKVKVTVRSGSLAPVSATRTITLKQPKAKRRR